jgi:uncharacterized protein DUF4157
VNDRDWQGRGDRSPAELDDGGGAQGDQRVDMMRRIAMQRRIQRKRAEGGGADPAKAPAEGAKAPAEGAKAPAEGDAPKAPGEAAAAEGDAPKAPGEAAAAEGDAPKAPGEAAPKEEAAAPASPPQPLPDNVKTRMERQLGADFSAVRIHANSPRPAQLGALAYTQGPDIHFAPGKYNPDSADGQRLLGHELAHVVQQGAARVKPPAPAQEKSDGKPDADDAQAKAPEEGPHADAAKPPVQKKGETDDPADPAEKEADAHGDHAAAAATKGDEDKKFSLGDKIKGAVGIGKQITIGKEKVRVYNEQEEAEAPKIIAEIKDKYGIEISSMATVDAIKAQYGNVPEDVKKGLTTMEWEFKELKALKAALDHYAPVLGKAREQSPKKDEAQEVTSIGKVKQAIDSNSKDGELDNSTLGEYFKGSKNFGMFKAGTNSHVDFKDSAKQLEATAVHEMAHGFFADQYDNFVAKGSDGYWIDQNTKSGDKKSEAPPTDYGQKNAREDLAESVMLYFVAEGTLSGKCPKRHAFIKKIVDAWQAKQGGEKDKDGGAEGGKAEAPKKAGCA